jgi:hypothetical protein
MAGVFFLYIAAWLIIVCVQFSQQTSFSRRVGTFVVSGQVRESAEGGGAVSRDKYPVNEYAKVSFGGIDFILSNDANNPLLLVDEDGGREALTVDTLSVSNDTAHFLLSDGVELIFYTQKSADTNGLLISGILPEKASALRLPYLPSNFAKMSVDNAGRWIVNANNVTYTFGRQAMDGIDQYLTIRRDDPMVFYHTEPKVAAFNPAVFIVRGGIEKTVYEEQLKLWGDKVYTNWEKNIATANSEALITAFLAEAARRGTYQGVRGALLQSSRASSARTYLSAPFLGRLDIALRTLSSATNGQLARLSGLLREDSSGLLDRRVSESWMIPAGKILLQEQGRYAGTVVLPDITLGETLDIFEGYSNWPAYFPNTENPFERLISRALDLAAEGLVKDEKAGNVFVADEGTVDVEFNLRLGTALAAYGDKNGASSWAGIGRSLVLSALALADDGGQVPAFLTVTGSGEIVALVADEAAAPEKIDAARIYPILSFAAYYPHTANFSGVQDELWVWTVAPETTAVFQNNILDISVSFPVGWTHHLLIRGVNQFSKIQLRDMDYRSDPRFEEYNSPGWVYSASEQTLLVKLLHRSEQEHIRIFY